MVSNTTNGPTSVTFERGTPLPLNSPPMMKRNSNGNRTVKKSADRSRTKPISNARDSAQKPVMVGIPFR